MSLLRELYQELLFAVPTTPDDREDEYKYGYYKGYRDAIYFALEGLDLILDEDEDSWENQP